MKFIKKNANIIVAVIVLILIVVGLLLLKEFFSPSETKAIYGNRLEGRRKIPFSEEQLKTIESTSADGIESTKARVAGRIIEITTKISAETSLESAKEIGNKLLESISDTEKGYYDIQIFIDKDNSSQFPIIGYKHHTKDGLVWTKDRADG